MREETSRRSVNHADAPAAPPKPTASSPKQGAAGQRVRQAILGMAEEWRRRPLTDYYLVLIVVSMLTGFGVVMVMSSSMAASAADGSGVWGTALRQAIMVALGLIAMWIMMRVRPGTLRRMSGIILVCAIVLLIAVLIPGIGTGREEVGSQSWIVVGPLRMQPSELARVAIAIWGAQFIARSHSPADRRRRLVTFAAVALAMTMLIFGEGDAGMAISFVFMAALLMFFGGMHRNFIIGLFAGLAVLMGMFLALGGFRKARLEVFLNALVGNFEDTKGAAYQTHQGFLSLGEGGLTGVGLGQSRAKWFYLPEAKNDFIFAIVNEETGLVGASIVAILFGLLGYVGLRVARRSANEYMMLLSATLTSGIVLQAFINMGYVSGVLPVTGIQLPMISAGGTSAIITLAAMGILANCARHEPEAISAMASYGRPGIDLLLMLPEPSVDEPRRVRRAEGVVPPTRPMAPRPHSSSARVIPAGSKRAMAPRPAQQRRKPGVRRPQ